MNNNPNPVYYPQPQPEPQKQTNGAAVAALILGIVSMLCCGLPASIAAIICAIVSKNKSPDGKMNGMAIAGLILGIVGVVMTVISLIVTMTTGMLPLLMSGDFESAMESIMR